MKNSTIKCYQNPGTLHYSHVFSQGQALLGQMGTIRKEPVLLWQLTLKAGGLGRVNK